MTADSTVTATAAPGAEYADTASAAYRDILQIIESVEPRIAAATRKELADQRDSLKLIASENYASPAVLLTMGTWLSDKYAEGTIGHRFYAGCQNVDTVEAVAAEHARELFGAPLRLRPAALRHRRQPRRLLGHPGHPRSRRPAWPRLGVKNVNDLSEADWEKLRAQARQPAAAGHVARRRRPPHPRLPARTSAARCSTSAATAPTPRPACSTTTRCAAAAREFKPLVLVGRLLGLPAAGQLRQDARDRRRGRRHADGRHGPLRGPGRGQGVHRRRGPGAARPRHDDDHAQVAARAARRAGAGHRGVRRRRRQGLPDGARRPALARDGRQGRRARRGASAGVPDLRAAGRRQRQGARRGLPEARRARWSPAAPTTTSCCSTSRRSG